jgi:hypothetical protein
MKRKKRRAPPKRRRPRRRPATTPAASPAETALLALARALAASTPPDRPARDALTSALTTLGTAFQAGAPLPRALAKARMGALGDKTRALALAWAREQLRLVLGELFDRAAAGGALRVGLATEPLAWVVLAACEALADEPPQAAPDRIRALEDWLTGARGDG